MTNLIIVLIPIVLILIIHLILKKRKRVKRKRREFISSQEFPKEWERILKKRFYLYNFLPINLQEQLKKHIMIFIDEKKFIGHNGVIIDDEVKVTIASQASMLLLNKKTDYYPRLETIELYPEAFFSKIPDKHGIFKRVARTGESWLNGRIILSWRHSKQEISKHRDGSNVVMHEFAHRFDQKDNSVDGIPTRILEDGQHQVFYKIISKAYKKHLKKMKKGDKLLISRYGGTNMAEFFAVYTEIFFEKGKQLRKKEPKLYKILKDFYKVDPAMWKIK